MGGSRAPPWSCWAQPNSLAASSTGAIDAPPLLVFKRVGFMVDTIYGEFEKYFVRDGDTLSSVANKFGITFRELVLFNFGTQIPSEINIKLREQVGCTQRTKDGKNYIFSDEDKPGLLLIPRKPGPVKLKTGSANKLVVKDKDIVSRIELETVDEQGQRLGNVDLVLKSTTGNPDVTLRTNKQGSGSAENIKPGEYKVLLADGSATFLTDAGKKGEPGVEPLKEAVVNTRHQGIALTRIVVQGKTKKEVLAERKVNETIHQQTGKSNDILGQGTETKGPSRRAQHLCADNLALAAGWTNNKLTEVNFEKLTSKILGSFLADYHPTPAARGYHVLVLVPAARQLHLFSSDGQFEDTFPLLPSADTRGLLGAYAAFEEVAGTTFVDMATRRGIVAVPGADGVFQIDQICEDSETLVARLNQHAGETQILFYAPTAEQLVALALLGGTGRLEDYGPNDDVNTSIHERNLAVCETLKVAYRSYILGYIERVKGASDEGALRRLGPPRSPFEMPAPIGVTDRQLSELFQAMHSNAEFDAWLAIAQRLDRFANRLSPGLPFFRIKPKFTVTETQVDKLHKFLRPQAKEVAKVPFLPDGEIDVELQMDVQLIDGEFEVVTKGDLLIKVKVKRDELPVKFLTKNKVAGEVSYKRSVLNPEKETVNIKIGNFSIEADTLGKSKMSLQTPIGQVDGEANTSTGMFGAGLTLKGKPLASAMRGKSDKLNKWANVIETMEVQFQVGIVGTREETVLAVVSNAPGFFERRSLAELFDPKTHWNDLTLTEQRNLIILGWHADSWDAKYQPSREATRPESIKKSRAQLSDPEKVAIVHLGFFAYEDYKKQFDQSVSNFADFRY